MIRVWNPFAHSKLRTSSRFRKRQSSAQKGGKNRGKTGIAAHWARHRRHHYLYQKRLNYAQKGGKIRYKTGIVALWARHRR